MMGHRKRGIGRKDHRVSWCLPAGSAAFWTGRDRPPPSPVLEEDIVVMGLLSKMEAIFSD